MLRALAVKEIRALFVSPVAYAVIAVFLLLSGYSFAVTLIVGRQASLVHVFFQSAVQFVLLVPILTMRLFAPGMSLLHRAGLGGLACTLKALERQYENGLLAETKLPAPFDGDTPPWEITDNSVTLHFGTPIRRP